MAGQVIMQGFVHIRIPIWLRRLLTMLPAFAVVGYGVNSTEALVLSQVVLSLTLPVPMVALVLLIRRRDVMGAYAAGPRLAGLAMTATGPGGCAERAAGVAGGGGGGAGAPWWVMFGRGGGRMAAGAGRQWEWVKRAALVRR